MYPLLFRIAVGDVEMRFLRDLDDVADLPAGEFRLDVIDRFLLRRKVDEDHTAVFLPAHLHLEKLHPPILVSRFLLQVT